MLDLSNVVKVYKAGDTDVSALKGISISFRKSEFVSILGPSGCGKTTLLNIVGGLDRYTSGDIQINGVSTKEYKESDWDNYRNHSIGFVFQSYNLIPHQSVLANVELALTLSGVSKAERKKKAEDVLRRVGLGDQIRKKPNQLSGGQMQRVAIARALVNDPEILLADEPTGALDSETSVQIMDLLKEISKDKLIIMVTHNPDLAEQYSSRIVRLLDGKIIGDTNPFDKSDAAEAAATASQTAEPAPLKKTKKKKKPSMSFFTAMSLSLNNLMTKKARTLLTSFAGSIGIIGIALILSLSNGINTYITDIQEETLASYPLAITAETTDLTSLMASLMTMRGDSEEHDNDAIYSSAIMYKLMNTLNNESISNDLKSFKTFLDKEMKEGTSEYDLYKHVSAIIYTYDVNINAYAKDPDGNYVKSDIMALFRGVNGMSSGTASYTLANSSYSSVWQQMLAPSDTSKGLVSSMITDEYDLLAGNWPESSDQVVLLVNRNNELSDLMLSALGLKSFDDMTKIIIAASRGEEVSTEVESWQYDEIVGRTFKVILDSDYYRDTNKDGIYENISNDSSLMNIVIDNGKTVTISGIIKAKEGADFAILNGPICYTEALSKEIINGILESDVVKAQMANTGYDVITGLPFFLDTDIPDSEKIGKFKDYCDELTDSQKRALYGKMLSALDEAEIRERADKYISGFESKEALIDSIIMSYAEPLGMDFETVKSIYGSTFEALTDEDLREIIVTFIRESANADGVIAELISTPTDEEINAIVAQSIELIKQMSPYISDDTTAKRAIILQYYTQSTQIDQIYLQQYAMSLDEEGLDKAVREIAVAQYASTPMTEEQENAKVAAAFDAYIAGLTDEELTKAYDRFTETSESTYETNLDLLGVADPEEPVSINIYTTTFASKDKIAETIEKYNESSPKEQQISYTDYVGLIMSSVTDIINAISYVLIAFVSISLFVSSIMIGIITYISVLERTKEIGILRSIGASKRDISRVFNAETLLVGFTAGMIGIIVTVLLCFPINAIIHVLTGITAINAALPFAGGVILVLISMVLTLVAGLIPAILAAIKDPVVALRTE